MILEYSFLSNSCLITQLGASLPLALVTGGVQSSTFNLLFKYSSAEKVSPSLRMLFNLVCNDYIKLIF